MCNFFSFCTQPSTSSNIYCFDWKQRLEMKHEGADSHSHICAYYKIDEDKCNKWEYNPLTKELVLDMQNDPKNDAVRVERWLDKLDWSKIVEPLIIKPFVNPFELPPVETVTDEQIGWLKEWDSVKVADWEADWALLNASVGTAVRSLVWVSVRNSAQASIMSLVWPWVWDEGTSNLWDVFWAYSGSFFKTESVLRTAPAIKLWEAGLVPTWDGSVWRLHTGPDARIVYEWKPEEK